MQQNIFYDFYVLYVRIDACVFQKRISNCNVPEMFYLKNNSNKPWKRLDLMGQTLTHLWFYLIKKELWAHIILRKGRTISKKNIMAHFYEINSPMKYILKAY